MPEPRPGRIRTADRAKHVSVLLATARRLFYRLGFSETTIESVARTARVSPKTIYARYGNKAGLFIAAMQDRVAAVLAELQDPVENRSDVEASLLAFATRLLTATTSPEALVMQRMVIAESARFPELGAAFYAAGPKHGIAVLAAFLVKATASGRLRVDEPEEAAQMFVGALLGVPTRTALITGQRPTRAQIERSAQATVAFFLAAYG